MSALRNPLPTGSVIQVDGPGGRTTAEILTYTRDGAIQHVVAKDTTGHMHHLAIDLAASTDAEMEVIDIGYARALAMQVLGGHRHRMPVALEASVLAEAVIALTGGR